MCAGMPQGGPTHSATGAGTLGFSCLLLMPAKAGIQTHRRRAGHHVRSGLKEKGADLAARPFGVTIFLCDQARRSKRSASITLVQAATKSFTNFSLLSSWA